MYNLDDAPELFKAVGAELTRDLVDVFQDVHGHSPDNLMLSKRIAAHISAVCLGVSKGDTSAINCVKEWRACLMKDRFHPSACRGLVRAWFRLQPLADGQCSLWGADARLVSALNTALLLFWKLRDGCLQKADTEAYRNRLRRSGVPCLTDYEAELIRGALRLGPVPHILDLIGKNGPGAVAERTKGAQKWVFNRRPISVPLRFYRVSAEHELALPDCATYKYGVARALQVPKDVRGPRFIACEPLASQHAQFAYERCLKLHLERCFRKHVFLASQRDHNRMLWGSSATIDLSDASDYISRRLIWRVLPDDWKRALFAVRSSFVQLDEHVVPLRAFAPMGSALCFPVMTLVIAGALRAAGLRRFHVYGDDVIVPIRDYPVAICWLEKLGVKINHSKSCSHGLFRESCGVELFGDVDVTPIYVRRLRTAGSQVDALVLYRSALRLSGKGFCNLGKFLLKRVRENLAFSKASLVDLTCFGQRWNRDYQRLEVRWPVETAKRITDQIDGYPGIMRWLCSGAAPGKGEPYTTSVDLRANYTHCKWVWLDKAQFIEELALVRQGTWDLESLA